jgi:hypothetical protein
VYNTGTVIDLTGPSWSRSYGSWIYNYLSNQCLSPLMLWVWIPIRARCTTLCDKVCQWLVTGWWFSPVSSTNRTDCHDITEILLKVALSTINQPANSNIDDLDAISHMVSDYQFYQTQSRFISIKWVHTCK